MDDVSIDDFDDLLVRFPVEHDGVSIRRVLPDDFQAFREYWTAPETFLYDHFRSYREDEIRSSIEAQMDVRIGMPAEPLLLTIEANEQVVGDATVTVLADQQGEIAIKLHPAHQGRGLATRALIGVLGMGFQQLFLHRIAASCDVRNRPAWRLLERVGMRREAAFVHDTVVKGEWVDTYVYAMLDCEWRKRYAPDSLDEGITE